MTINRREAIALTAGVLGAGLFDVKGQDQPRSITSDRFSQPLHIPPVLKPDHADADTDYYTLVERESTMEILPGHKTRIWGYNGLFPGPTLAVQRCRRCLVEVRNELGVPTTTHLHGGVTESDSDGFPTDMVMPGQSRSYTYSNVGRASTLWYHDHSMDRTGHNIYMGLAGLYIVRDEQEEQLNLPAEEFDIPLLLQQRQFAADGSFAYHMGDHIGAGGDTTLVNGVPWPRVTVQARKYRFRIVNGSNSTAYKLALSSGNPLIQIATDGGLLARPVACAWLRLTMAERAEVVIDFSDYKPGSSLFLLSVDSPANPKSILRFDVIEADLDDSELPERLSVIEPLEEHTAVRTRVFHFEGRPAVAFPPVNWVINGHKFNPDRVEVTARLGEVEIWRFVNHHAFLGHLGMLHPVHVHLSPFQILRRNGRPPEVFEAGWKDTVSVEPGETVDVLVRFEHYRGRYLLHCHNLEHEDHAMMARFDVI